MIKIFPSLMKGDLTCLKKSITLLEHACAGFHIDIMDRDFVDNVTWGPDTINALRTITHKPFWLHLMTKNPQWYMERLVIQTNDIVSLHCEVTPSPTLFTYIKQKKAVTSIAINPDTPLEKLEPFLPFIEHILIMSVHPGFAGQLFIPETFHRLDKLTLYKKLIGIDGGITKNLAQRLATYTINSLAVSSAIFHSNDPLEELTALNELLS